MKSYEVKILFLLLKHIHNFELMNWTFIQLLGTVIFTVSHRCQHVDLKNTVCHANKMHTTAKNTIYNLFNNHHFLFIAHAIWCLLSCQLTVYCLVYCQLFLKQIFLHAMRWNISCHVQFSCSHDMSTAFRCVFWCE